MRYDYVILFAYHANDQVTSRHHDLLRWYNASVPVIPIIAGNHGQLPGSIDLSVFPSAWDVRHPWYSLDTFIYRWFLNRNVEAKRYIFVEWDVLCCCDARQFFTYVWDCPVVATHVIRHPARWMWFKDVYKLGEAQRGHALGLAPLAATLYSHEALLAICSGPTWYDVFSELRIGTTANLLGIPIATNPVARRTISWHESYIDPAGEAAFYHPVKSLLY